MGDLWYLVIWIPAALAIRWGWRRINEVEPPAGEVRTLKLGRLVTDPEEKLAVHRQKGMIALLTGLALIVGPLLAEAAADEPASAAP